MLKAVPIMASTALAAGTGWAQSEHVEYAPCTGVNVPYRPFGLKPGAKQRVRASYCKEVFEP